ncbi:MAG TPA: ABC transporter permease [Actinomycetales bacterium]|nr:ABC transporter permease [Actinomycetales bacterium]
MRDALEPGWVVSDSLTMIGRSLRLSIRNLDALITAVVLPVMLMLLFVYVFGGAIDTGTEYVNYVVPGIVLLCTGFGSATTAVSVAADVEEGIVDRFRSMAISRSAVLTGHVVASVVRNAFSTLVVVLVAVAVGFRPDAGLLPWLGAVGVLLLWVLAITWVSVCFGLLAGSAEAANGMTFTVLFLPYVSSAFVPVETMPSWMRPVAEHQPITPVIETVRGFLLGTPTGTTAWLALAWTVGLLVIAFVAATVLFGRRTAG